MGALRRYLLFGNSLLLAGGPAATIAEARAEVIPGAATGLHKLQPSFSGGGGSSLLFLPKTRKRGDADGAVATAARAVIPGKARGVARAAGASAARVVTAHAPAVGGRARIEGAVATGPLKYWIASKWSPEYLAKLRDEDEILLAAIL